MLRIIAIMIAGLILLPGLMTSSYATHHVSVGEIQADVKRILPRVLKGLLDKGETILIVDVRSVNAYKNQHIAGAMSVPLKEVETNLSVLPPETKIVFY